MKKCFLFALLMTSTVCCLSALSMTSRDASDFPDPDKIFQARITDRHGFTTSADKISVEGNTYFSLERGDSTFFIPFDKIQTIDFADIQNDRINTVVTLNNGEKMNATADSYAVMFGETSFGQFRIQLEGINKIKFVSQDSDSP